MLYPSRDMPRLKFVMGAFRRGARVNKRAHPFVFFFFLSFFVCVFFFRFTVVALSCFEAFDTTWCVCFFSFLTTGETVALLRLRAHYSHMFQQQHCMEKHVFEMYYCSLLPFNVLPFSCLINKTVGLCSPQITSSCVSICFQRVVELTRSRFGHCFCSSTN